MVNTSLSWSAHASNDQPGIPAGPAALSTFSSDLYGAVHVWTTTDGPLSGSCCCCCVPRCIVCACCFASLSSQQMYLRRYSSRSAPSANTRKAAELPGTTLLFTYTHRPPPLFFHNLTICCEHGAACQLYSSIGDVVLQPGFCDDPYDSPLPHLVYLLDERPHPLPLTLTTMVSVGHFPNI